MRVKKSAAREDGHAVRKMKPAPAWLDNAWWDAQAYALDEHLCERNGDHGLTRIRDYAMFGGRTLSYNCSICGWEKVVLVQEGQLEPCAPATELPPPTREHMRRVALGQRGAKVRAEKFAARKALEADDDDV